MLYPGDAAKLIDLVVPFSIYISCGPKLLPDPKLP